MSIVSLGGGVSGTGINTLPSDYAMLTEYLPYRYSNFDKNSDETQNVSTVFSRTAPITAISSLYEKRGNNITIPAGESEYITVPDYYARGAEYKAMNIYTGGMNYIVDINGETGYYTLTTDTFIRNRGSYIGVVKNNGTTVTIGSEVNFTTNIQGVMPISPTCFVTFPLPTTSNVAYRVANVSGTTISALTLSSAIIGDYTTSASPSHFKVVKLNDTTGILAYVTTANNVNVRAFDISTASVSGSITFGGAVTIAEGSFATIDIAKLSDNSIAILSGTKVTKATVSGTTITLGTSTTHSLSKTSIFPLPNDKAIVFGYYEAKLYDMAPATPSLLNSIATDSNYPCNSWMGQKTDYPLSTSWFFGISNKVITYSVANDTISRTLVNTGTGTVSTIYYASGMAIALNTVNNKFYCGYIGQDTTSTLSIFDEKSNEEISNTSITNTLCPFAGGFTLQQKQINGSKKMAPIKSKIFLKLQNTGTNAISLFLGNLYFYKY